MDINNLTENVIAFLDGENHQPEKIKQIILHKIDYLPEKEQLVINHRYSVNGNAFQTLQQLGNTLNVCKERIRQHQGKALRRLRKYVNQELILKP